ncbi:NAD(P)-binding domain-containing protein [Paenisporosarcina sp. NPDC076898]|uniref:NAD(P)-binding domain-containing protein n=1 Tax=unclassified Paenisporosarcina TaxID=2642018 RepID=UPI003CFEA3CB
MTNEKMSFNILTNCCSSPKPKEEASALPTVIIGAGPVGLAAAAHLAAKKEPFLMIEVGPTVGHNILKWGHVRLFSPWQYNIDKVALKLLEDSEWKAPVMKRLPFGKDLVEDYLIPLANLPQIKPFIKLNAKVVAISKQGLDKMKDANRDQQSFILYIEQEGNTERIEAKAVIDASGTWAQPNPVNADNVWTKGEELLSAHISYGIPNIKGTERSKFEQKRVAVVGGGHSAINTILELAELEGTEIVWILRKNRVEEVYGGEARDALPARGQLGSRIHQLVDSGKISVHTPFLINEIVQDNGKLTIHGTMRNEKYSIDTIDEIISNTGSRPDFSFLREVRLDIDAATESVSALAPLIDPNIHSCGTIRPHGEAELRQPEKNFYLVGVKSYGRAPTFLMATGYEQVRSIVAHLTGDQEAAKRVELDLPETGVCSTNIGGKSSCC